MKRSLYVAMAAMLCLGLVISAGCAKKQVVSPSQVSAEEKARLEAERQRKLKEAQLKEKAAREAEAQLKENFTNQDVHFDYDRWDLSTEAKQVLNDKASYLMQHPAMSIIVEGHCDERGSNAYNMALGEKRAKACAAYLEAMGIDTTRLETVSYGEEKPLVLGTTEEAYAANRRGHFVVK